MLPLHDFSGAVKFHELRQNASAFYKKSWKTSAVSTTVWMVGTQLCKLRGTSDTFVPGIIICFLWAKPTIWLLILSFTQNIVRACSMFYPHEGYRSVTPLDAARVNRTIFDNHYMHWYYITLVKGRDYIKPAFREKTHKYGKSSWITMAQRSHWDARAVQLHAVGYFRTEGYDCLRSSKWTLKPTWKPTLR